MLQGFLVRSRSFCHALLAVRFILAEIAGHEMRMTVTLESENVCANSIQKPAIVRHYNGTADEIRQRIF
jgi:hypothetical protein